MRSRTTTSFLRLRTVLVALVAVAFALSSAVSAQAATSPLRTSVDSTYQTNGRVSAIVTVGTTTYLAGSFTSMRPARTAAGGPEEQPRDHLAAIDSTTGALLPWAPALDAPAYAIAASPDGATIYVGGSFAKVNGLFRPRIAAIDASSGATTAFKVTVNLKVLAIAVTTGRVYLGGTFTKVAGQPRSRLAAVGTDGTLVAAWHPSADAQVLAITPSPDGASVYVGGAFTSIDGLKTEKNLTRLTVGTAAPVGWTSHPSYPVWAIVVTSDQVYVGGNGIGGHAGSYSVDGVPGWITQTDGGVQSIALMDGVLYIGGHFDNVCLGDNAGATKGFNCPQSSATRHKLVAVDASTGATDPWAPNANSAVGVMALAAGNGRLLVGGDFTAIGAHPRAQQQGFAQLS